ncbi:MAG: phosphoribosylglycinamide synthetase C domain-containing protein, partial [Terrimicrobiaceae bacterium]
RWGDPETQVLVRRLSSDLLPLLEATADGILNEVRPEWDERAAVCVILASGGYPGAYEKGKVISGLEAAGELGDVVVFHAGTTAQAGQILTNGGRVLGVTALGANITEARALAYGAADRISFEGVQRRNDIGA